jgi:putative intracellular protease/amidase
MATLASSTKRGYGKEHRAERLRVKARIDAEGGGVCVYCHGPIAPGEKFHLAHSRDRKADGAAKWLGEAHPLCNQRAATALRESRRRARQEVEFVEPVSHPRFLGPDGEAWSRMWITDPPGYAWEDAPVTLKRSYLRERRT